MRLPVGVSSSNWLAQMAPFGSVRQRLGEAAGHLHVVVGIGVGHRRHFHQRGAGELQHVLLFLGLRLGNDDHGAKSEGAATRRRSMSVLPAVPSTITPPGRSAARHRIPDDAERGTVLHRLAGIEELGFPE